jgi:hypothetical protein
MRFPEELARGGRVGVQHSGEHQPAACTRAYEVHPEVRFAVRSEYSRRLSPSSNVRLRLIQHAVFGSDPFRFAAMLGECDHALN